jgi:cysteine desulfurase
MIYLDYAATTPMSERAIETYRQAATRFYGNSNSLHDAGSNASALLESSRKLIASELGVHESGLHFTGSGSEAVFLSLVALAEGATQRGRHIVTAMAEHSCVRNTFHWLAHQGFEITMVPSAPDGSVDLEALKGAVRTDTTLVSIQYVNSETGAVNPLQEIGEWLQDRHIHFHSDATQGFGKLPLDPIAWGLDAVTLSAHKIHGPKGLGATYINPKRKWSPMIPETSQEHGFRMGTVDVPAVAAFATAAKEMAANREASMRHVRGLKEALVRQLREKSGDAITMEGNPDTSSPYIAGLRVHRMEGQFAMLECSQRGLAISTGSACQVNEQKPSATMKAIGYDDETAKQFIRLSLDAATTMEEIGQATDILADIIQKHLSRLH